MTQLDTPTEAGPRRRSTALGLVAILAATGAVAVFQASQGDAAGASAEQWRVQEDGICSEQLPELSPIAVRARERVGLAAAASAETKASDAARLRALAADATKIAESVRGVAADFNRVDVPDKGIDADQVERVLSHSKRLAAAWDGLATEYGELAETKVVKSDRGSARRVADLTSDANAASLGLSQAHTRLGLIACARFGTEAAATAPVLSA